MKNVIYPILLLVSAFTGCRGKGAQKAETDTVSLTQVGAKPDVPAAARDLDTSMSDLKTTRSIALETLLCQTWAFEDADKAHWNEIFWDPLEDIRLYPELALFADHKVVLNPRCGLAVGGWALNKDTRELSLIFKDGTSRSYLIRQVALRQLELGWKKDGWLAIIRLKADGIVEKHPERDPYYASNLGWRVKPAAAESEEQLRKRVRGCVHFFSLFFADNHNRQATEISFNGLPSCFVWYNGGIGMQAKTSLDKRWVGCFYSESQANRAYELVAAELEKHSLKWPEHPTSWVEQTGQVLAQLETRF